MKLREQHKWVLSREVHAHLHIRIPYQPAEIIAQRYCTNFQERAVKIAKRASVFWVIAAHDAARLGILCICIRGRPVINFDIVPAAAQQIKVTACAVNGAEQDAAFSVKANNAKEIFGKPDVDGGLIGGASLHASEFAEIIGSLK